MDTKQHGTFWIYERTEQYVVAAIDSRVVLNATTHRDNYCKFIFINPNRFAFSAGVTGIVTNGVVRNDINDIIRQVPKTLDSEEMAKMVVRSFASQIATLPGDARTKEFTDIFFVEETNTGLLQITNGHIDFTSTEATMSVRPASAESVNRSSQNQTLFDELSRLDTDRARTLHGEIGRLLGTGSPAERAAANVTTVVQGMINWSGQHSIGGEPATIILEKGNAVRWYTRPSFCQ